MTRTLQRSPRKPAEVPLSTELLEKKQTFVTRILARIGGGRTPAALFDQGLVSGANFITNVILARSFGVREYGVFALAWVAVLFANSLQYAMIVTPMMSVGPKQDPEDRPAYYGSVLVQEIVFGLFVGLVMFICVWLSARFFPSWRVADLAIPISFATIAYMLQEFLRRYFFCTSQSKRALTCDIVSYLTQVPIIFWLSRSHGAKLSSMLWVIAVTSLIGFFTCLRWYEHVTFSWHSLRTVFLRHWRMSRWLAPSAFMQWGASNLFQLSAPVYFGAAASAALRAAQNIVAVAHVWFLGLDNVVPAEAARRMRHGGVEGMLRYIRRIFLQWGGVTLAFTGLVGCFPTFWLKLAYGTKYAGDGNVLRMFACLYLVVFVSGPLRYGLQALEYTAPIFWTYPVMIVFSVALAGPLAHKLGMNGVMLGMVSSQVLFQGLIGIAFWMRIRKIRREAALESTEALHPL
jgi:O-antigen/teichoic acid export membrane protein